MPASEETLTMVPAPDALSRGWASWVRWNADSRLVLIINLYSSGVMATIGFTNPVPALLTYTTSTTSSQAAQITSGDLFVAHQDTELSAKGGLDVLH